MNYAKCKVCGQELATREIDPEPEVADVHDEYDD